MRAWLDRITGLRADMLEPVLASFAPRLRASTGAAWRALPARHPAAVPPSLVMPPSFAHMLASAIALEEREGFPERAERLRAHYLDLMPRLRTEQLATTAEPNATLFHSVLDWDRLPRLRGARERLGALTGAAPSQARTVAELYAATYYGGFMPVLYGFPADLALVARHLAEAGADLHDVLDRQLTAPLLHELTHLQASREAILPVYLDECIAGHLGVRVHRGFAYPPPGEDTGLYAAPWFAQVGQALVRAFGLDAIARAHAGQIPWEQAVPAPVLEQALVRGWEDYRNHRKPHFLSDNFDPRPWLAPILAHIPNEHDDDEDVIADALRAMSLRNHQVAGAFRVTSVARATPIQVDLSARWVSAPPGIDGFDPVPLGHWFPPHVASRLQAMGISGYSLILHDLGAIPEAAHVLKEGDRDVVSAGYTLQRM